MMNDENRKSGPRGIDWSKAKLLFLNGISVSGIARKIGVRRETVSRVKNRERWADDLHEVRVQSARAVQETIVRDNVAVLRDHDEIGSKLLQAAKLQIDAELAEGQPSLRKLRDAAIIAAHGAELQRAARAIRPDESMISKRDEPFVVTLRKSPDLTAFELLVTALGGDRQAAQEALRRASDAEVLDTA